MIRLNCSLSREHQRQVTSRLDGHSCGLMHVPGTCCTDNLSLETASEVSAAKAGMHTSWNNQQMAGQAAQVPHLLHLDELIFGHDES